MARGTTLKVFNEPWRYSRAQGEGGGEGRRAGAKKGMKREGGHDEGSNRGADFQQMSHCQ